MQLNNLVNRKITIPKTINLNKMMFYIVLLDILFLPYIRSLSASLSMVLLPIWFILNIGKFRLTKENLGILTLFLLTTISLISSNFIFSTEVFRANIVNVTIFIYGILYFVFFKYMFTKYDIPINNIFNLYLAFGLALAFLYFLNPSLYFSVRSFWTMSGNVIEVTDSLSIHRFTSTFSDPNNTAIMFNGIAAFLLFNYKNNPLREVFIMISIVVITTATMSSTGFIILFLTSMFFVVNRFSFNINIRFKKESVLLIILLMLFIPIIIIVFSDFLTLDITQTAIDRVSDNSLSSRIHIWTDLLQSENIFKYLFVGMGGNVFIRNFIYLPHNGHLHLIYNYGMIVYSIFVSIYFRKRPHTNWKEWYFIIPLLLGFTVNIGIIEPRFFNIMSILVARYAANSTLKRE